MSNGVNTNERWCCATFTILMVLTAAAHGRCTAAEPDSISTIDWTLLYAGRIDLTRRDEIFPWNDPEAVAHRNDRLVSMLLVRPHPAWAVFLKGASGYRREREGVPRNRFALAQGHVGFDAGGGGVRGRLFLRERSFRTTHKLLPLVSNDSPFLDGRGEGLRLDVEGSSGRFHLRYIESTLRTEDLSIRGGLPAFGGGGELFRIVSGSLRLAGGTRIGLTASEVRSVQSGRGLGSSGRAYSRTGLRGR